MKRALVAITLVMSASFAHAEMIPTGLVTDIIEALNGLKKGAATELLKKFSVRFNNHIGQEAISKEGFTIVATGTKRKDSVVMKVMEPGSRDLGWVRNETPEFVSQGELKFGIFRVPSGDLKKQIKEMVLEQGEVSIFTKNAVDRNSVVTGELLGYLHATSASVENDLIAIAKKLGVKEDDVIVAFPQIVKLPGEANYGFIESININFRNLSATQVQAFIEEAQALL